MRPPPGFRGAPAAPGLKAEDILSQDSVTTEDKDGQKFVNQYKVLETLGKGCFGKVKLVEVEKTGEQRAIKILKKSLLKKRRPGQPDLFQNVLREVAIMKKLDHPNCCRLYEALDDAENNKIILVIEYISGGTVAEEMVKPTPDRIGRCRRWFRDLVSGLAYLHMQRIVHRDIKPENMLLTKEGVVKLSDFGVSLIVEDEQQQIGATAGTPAFMAPEACSVGKYKGAPTDVWACGVCLFQFITQKLPFEGDNLPEIYRKIKEDPVPYPDDLDPQLRDLLEQLLCKDPDDRVTIEEVKSHPWLLAEGGRIEETTQYNKVHVSEADISYALKPIDSFRMLLALKSKMSMKLEKQRERRRTSEDASATQSQGAAMKAE